MRGHSLGNEGVKPGSQELVRGWGGDQPREEERRQNLEPSTRETDGEKVTHPLGALISY